MNPQRTVLGMVEGALAMIAFEGDDKTFTEKESKSGLCFTYRADTYGERKLKEAY
jgi:hypothetical protein